MNKTSILLNDYEQQRWGQEYVTLHLKVLLTTVAKVTADNMEKPLNGAVLCCTSIPPEQRVRYRTEHRLMEYPLTRSRLIWPKLPSRWAQNTSWI